MKKYISFTAIIFAISFVLVACNDDNEEVSESPNNDNTSEEKTDDNSEYANSNSSDEQKENSNDTYSDEEENSYMPNSDDENQQTSYFNVILKDYKEENDLKTVSAIRDVTGLELKETKDIVVDAPASIDEIATEKEAKELEDKLEELDAEVEIKENNSKKAQTAVELQGEEFNVILEDFSDDKRIKMIKRIGEVADFGLEDSKKIADSVPEPIKENVSIREAFKTQKRLEQTDEDVKVNIFNVDESDDSDYSIESES